MATLAPQAKQAKASGEIWTTRWVARTLSYVWSLPSKRKYFRTLSILLCDYGWRRTGGRCVPGPVVSTCSSSLVVRHTWRTDQHLICGDHSLAGACSSLCSASWAPPGPCPSSCTPSTHTASTTPSASPASLRMIESVDSGPGCLCCPRWDE